MTGMDKVRFATFFPGTFYPGTNIHLDKDIGMIPHVLCREYGYDSRLIAYGPKNKDEKEDLLKDVPEGVRMQLIPKGPGYLLTMLLKKIFNRSSGALRYNSPAFELAEGVCVMVDSFLLMMGSARDIDVLQLYHFKPESMLMALVYRLFNKKGIIYVKLDMNPDIIEDYRKAPGKKNSPGSRVSGYLIRALPIDLFSVESLRVYEFVRSEHPLFKKFGERVCYIPNGVDVKRLSLQAPGPKENIVLHAGRIGNFQKRTEVALEAFRRAAKETPAWKLILVGPMEEKFKGYFDAFLRDNPDIRDRVEYKGFLRSKDDVFKLYSRARVLAMPSLFESFGLVVVEAQLFGDVVLGSDIPAVRELTDDGRLGFLCPVDDVGCFAKALGDIMSGKVDLAARSGLAAEFTRKNFDWGAICGRLDERIRAARLEKAHGGPASKGYKTG